MLYRQEPAELIAITQPTHAWISGCLSQIWGNADFGDFAPKAEVCLSAEQHDIGWLVWESIPTLNPKTGYPHSFIEIPTEVHIGIWSGAKQLALPFGRYVALLISLHGTRLYECHTSWQKSPEASVIVPEFLKQEYAFQNQLIASLEQDPYYALYTTPAVIKRNRSLIATWDLLSLALCQGVRDRQELTQIPTAFGETTLTLTPVNHDGTQVKVTPWPFQKTSEVKLVFEGRIVKEKFKDETAMRTALAAANCTTITTTLIC